MLKEGIDLGGEGSGHLIILDKQTTGDGIVSSLQVLSVLARNRSTLESVLSEVALTPQVLINRRYKPATFGMKISRSLTRSRPFRKSWKARAEF